MSDAAVIALLAPLAYLLGTFPSAELVARRRGVDVTAAGSGNPGASNAFRLLGWRGGALVLVMDAAKGALAAGGGMLVDNRRGALILGAVAIVGHVLPLTRRLKGGRGVATAAGALLVLYFYVTLGAAVAWWVVVRITHKASVASIVVVVAFPGAVAIAGFSWGEVAVLGVVAALLVVRHASNLGRLIRGTELDIADRPHDSGAPGDAGA